ncbi:hypothetical protein [Actinomadura hibisca]|uniref:hypothetical protein n=1 Tax=Actinomadura hibisca TaxID=68565 RepID=UPI0008352CE6|nr:hypothetical protein [Actinomadura hibisca]
MSTAAESGRARMTPAGLRRRTLPGDADRPRRATVRSVPWLLLAGWAAQVAVRLVLTARAEAPLVYPDEAGYLVAARWLTGGVGGDFSGSTFYQPGYALLLVPAYLMGDDPSSVFRTVLVTNALIGALAFPLGHLALRRLGFARTDAFALAWAAALLPATTLFGSGALVDAVLPVIVLGWLLALDRFVRGGGAAAGIVSGLVAVYAYATHMRGTVVLGVHVLVLAGCLVARRPRRAAASALAVVVVGGVAAALLNGHVRDALYPGGPKDHTGILIDHLTSFGGQVWALSGSAGQLWAMICGTWGLGGLGLVAVLGVLLRRRSPAPDRIMAGVLLAVTAGVSYGSVAALPNEHRVGNFAYGRYIACVALVYTLVGLAALARLPRARNAVAGALALLVGTAACVRLYGGSRLETYTFMGWDFPEVGLLALNYQELELPTSTLVAGALMVALWGLGRWGVAKLAVGLFQINLIAALFINLTLVRYAAYPFASPPVRAGGVAVDERHPVDYRPDPPLLTARLAVAVDWTGLERFDPRRGAPRAGVCTAIVSWPVGILAADSWPRHPPGWQYRREGLNGIWWVYWWDPACATGGRR